MKKIRVPKGEKYWYINDCLYVSEGYERGICISEVHFIKGNYFHTQEEAESAARKLCAILKGAEVIETSQAVLAFNDFLAKLKEDRVIDYDEGVKYMKEFKSKIVK